MEIVASAPRTVAEGDAGSTGRCSLCIAALHAAADNPMTEQQYQRFHTASAYWLDAWPLIVPFRRQRLLATIESVLGGFAE